MHNHISVIYDTLQSIRNTRRAVQRSGEFPTQLAALRTIEHRAQALLRALQEKQYIDKTNNQNRDISTAAARDAGLAKSSQASRARRRALAQKSGRGRHRGDKARWKL